MLRNILKVSTSFPLRHAGSGFKLNAVFRAYSASKVRATTILCVRKDGHVVMAGDGQVSLGSTVVKGTVRKVRKLPNDIMIGFAGSTADALTLLERLEKKLEEYPGQLMRACVELAKAWRSDKYLRRLEVVTYFISVWLLTIFVYRRQ